MSNQLLIDEIATALKSFVETPYLDARFFCEYYKDGPTSEQVSGFIARRIQGEPVSKIIGRRGFWKRDFYVTRDVLDPRPDSETLIEAVLNYYPERNEGYRILDIGTGSGCLLLSLSDEFPKAECVGVDKSEAALIVARENDSTNSILFQQADFTLPEFGNDLGQFDIIISNPPYIPTADIDKLEASVRLYDPMSALDGGTDGLSAYRALAMRLPNLLKPNGLIFFEIGQGQENDVIQIMMNTGFSCLEQKRDLGGIIRVLVFK